MRAVWRGAMTSAEIVALYGCVCVESSDVTRRAEASKRVSSNDGGVSAKRVSRLASFRGGAKNDDVRSLAARPYHVIASGSGSDFAARFNGLHRPLRLHSKWGLL